jgi:hypothetical protein
METGLETLRKLCRALGIDPDGRQVTKIVIECTVEDVARATIYELIEEHGKIIELASKIFAREE